MRGDQLSRQWKILMYLSTNTVGKRLSQISEEVDCSERNVRRDLQALQEAGFSIHTEKLGQTTVWKMADSFNRSPPIPITSAETIALLLIETEVRSHGDDFISEAFAQVIEKILRSRPADFRKQMELLREKFYAGSTSKSAPARETQNLYELITEAITRGNKISVTYQNAAGEVSSGRILAPLHIWIVNTACYLVAYCYENEQIRTFHLKRFLDVKELQEKFESKWSFDMQKHAEEAFGVFHATPRDIEIWLDPILQTYIQDHPIHTSQIVTRQKDGIIVTFKVGINESLVSRILGFGSMARVLAPDSLAILIMEKHRNAFENYAAPMPVAAPSLPLIFE